MFKKSLNSESPIRARGSTILASAKHLKRTELTKIFDHFLVIGIRSGESVKPSLLYKFPEDKELEVIGVLQFCFPDEKVEVKTVPKINSQTITESIEQDHQRTSFTFILTLGIETQNLLYAYCVIQYQLVKYTPSFCKVKIDSIIEDLQVEPQLSIAPCCYCFLSKFPFFETHKTILNAIIDGENTIANILYNASNQNVGKKTSLSPSLPNLSFNTSHQELITDPAPSITTETSDQNNINNNDIKLSGDSGKERVMLGSAKLLSLSPSEVPKIESKSPSDSTDDDIDNNPLSLAKLDFNEDNAEENYKLEDNNDGSNIDNTNGKGDQISLDSTSNAEVNLSVETQEKDESNQNDSINNNNNDGDDLENKRKFLGARPMGKKFGEERMRMTRMRSLGDGLVKTQSPTRFRNQSYAPEPPNFISKFNEREEIRRERTVRIPRASSLNLSNTDLSLLYSISNLLENYYNLSIHNTHSVTTTLSFNSKIIHLFIPSGIEVELLADWAFPYLFRTLSYRDIIGMYTMLLYERSLTVISSSLDVSSSIVISVIPMLHPLVWQGPLIPVLPSSLYGYLDAPVPTITGVKRIPSATMNELISAGVVIDCDKKTLLTSRKITKLPNKSKLSELKSIHQQYHSLKGNVMTEQESSALCREALRQFMSYFAAIEENITRALQSQILDDTNRIQAILNGTSSQYFDFMKEVIDSQHITMWIEKIEHSISNTRASLKTYQDKVNSRIIATEDEIDAFEQIIAAQIRKRDALKDKLELLYKAKNKLNAGQIPSDISSIII